MTSPRRLSIALLVSATLIPTAAHAQDDPAGPHTWVASEDGSFFAAALDPGATPGISPLGLDDVPDPLVGQSLPDDVFRVTIDPPGAGAVHVARIFEGEDTPDPGAGRRPVVVLFGANDNGAAFASQQRSFSSGPTCAAAADGPCLDAEVRDDLLGAIFDGEQTPFSLDPAGDGFVADGVIEEPGAVVALAGGASVETTVRTRPGDPTFTVRGQADIVPAFDGRFSGFDAQVIDTPGPGVELDLGPIVHEYGQSVAILGATKVKKNGTANRTLECPASGRGVVASHFRFDQLGRGAGGLLGIDGLQDGTTVIFTQLDPVTCGAPPPMGPYAAVGCIDFSILHTKLGKDPTRVVIDGVVYTLGVPAGSEPTLDATLGGMNGGQPLSIDLVPIELVPLDLESVLPIDVGPGMDGEPVRAWSFEGAGGVNTFGPKQIKSVEFSADGVEPIELRPQVRSIAGKSIKVAADETTSGNCSPFGDPTDPEALPGLAADLFASVDASGWSHARP